MKSPLNIMLFLYFFFLYFKVVLTAFIIVYYFTYFPPPHPVVYRTITPNVLYDLLEKLYVAKYTTYIRNWNFYYAYFFWNTNSMKGIYICKIPLLKTKIA